MWSFFSSLEIRIRLEYCWKNLRSKTIVTMHKVTRLRTVYHTNYFSTRGWNPIKLAYQQSGIREVIMSLFLSIDI